VKRLLTLALVVSSALVLAQGNPHLVNLDALTQNPMESVTVAQLGSDVMLVSNTELAPYTELEAPSGSYQALTGALVINKTGSSGVDLKSFWVATPPPLPVAGNVPGATTVTVKCYDANGNVLETLPYTLESGWQQIRVQAPRAHMVIIWGNGDGSAPMLLDNLKVHQH